MQPLPVDLESLVRRVCACTGQLLALQDHDPDAPTSGCFHPAHWRDKTAGFADMRRQEAVLPLAWMWRHSFPGNDHQGDPALLHASLRGLRYWCALQHSDGTFDEWYSQEHGYATTAFSAFAVALTVQALGEELRDPLRGQVLKSLTRAAEWLRTHDDWFKTNHEAVGVAALGMAGLVLNQPRFSAASEGNAAAIAARQHPEGWSREVGACDVGYSFLLAEYLALHAVLCKAPASLGPARRAFGFAAHFLHPDLTTGAEYGICANAYVSRLAAVALAPHDAQAAAMLRWMERAPAAQPTGTLEDDLRLCRWAFQPLLAALLHQGVIRSTLNPEQPVMEPLFFERQHADFSAPGAGLSAHARPGYVAWISACSGASVRVCLRTAQGFTRPSVDRGATAGKPGRALRSFAYAAGRSAQQDEGALLLTAPLQRCRFVQPTPLQRLALAVAVRLPGGPRWARRLIDLWRARKGTALNQSVAAVAGGASALQLVRRVRLEPSAPVIEDLLSGPADSAEATLWIDDERLSFGACGAQQSSAGLALRRQVVLQAGQPCWRLANHPGSPSA